MTWLRVAGSERPWHRRDVVIGALRLRMDVWPADDECTRWVYGLNGGPSQNGIPFKSLTAAMSAAEAMMKCYLLSAARQLRAEPTSTAGTAAGKKGKGAE